MVWKHNNGRNCKVNCKGRNKHTHVKDQLVVNEIPPVIWMGSDPSLMFLSIWSPVGDAILGDYGFGRMGGIAREWATLGIGLWRL